jgi:radial spoke head protein 9
VPCPQKVKKLKEEDRLVCLVHMIMCESAIIPRGILYRQATQKITYNPCFSGLSRLEAGDMKNFQLFRAPRNNFNYNLTKREDYNYQTDFFDTLDDLIPKNCFTCIINDCNVCLIRALNWPGMTFAHKLNTAYQGFFYFGNGKRNLDLLFMT